MENNEVVYLYLDDIIPNRFQPREIFDDQALKELAVSIKEHGVIQPIIVRKVENKYEIIAGERRYKASTMAGLTKIPAIVKNLDDKESSKVALIENLQRKDLSPIEEARTYQKILELEQGMTQEELAATMGKTQSAVSNKIRLLALPDEVQDALLNDKISERHARSLLNITDKNDQIRMLDKVIAEKMTVRELDKEIREMNEINTNGNVSIGDVKPNVDSNSLNVENNMNINVPTVSVPEQSISSENHTVTNDIAKEVSTPSLNNVESMLNPTVVDINKIRESAQDINVPVEHNVDVKDLMKDTSVKENNGFKFVDSQPMENENTALNANSFDNFAFKANEIQNPIAPSINNLQNELSVSNNSNSILNFDGTNVGSSDNQTPNVNIPSSVSSSFTPSFNIGNLVNQNKRDVMPAVGDIKNAIKEVESKGYKIVVFENDNDNSYQITINIDKNE